MDCIIEYKRLYEEFYLGAASWYSQQMLWHTLLHHEDLEKNPTGDRSPEIG